MNPEKILQAAAMIKEIIEIYTILETQRLILREFQPEDSCQLARIKCQKNHQINSY